MLCLIKKLQLKRIASRDADDLYERFLIQHRNKSKEGTEINPTGQPSEWMNASICDYIIAVDKLINKSTGILTLYNKIKQNYARANEINSEFDKKKAEINAQAANVQTEIDTIEAELEQILQLQSDFHEGKPLPNGLTPPKLNSSKNELEKQRTQKQAQRELILTASSIKTERDKLDKHLKKLGRKVKRLESNFSQHIDLLYQKIRKTEIEYNEQINYYRKKLCAYIQNIHLEENDQYHSEQNISAEFAVFIKAFQLSQPAEQLKDLAQLYGKRLLSKEDLFKNERTFINTTINPSFSIQYVV